MTPEDAVQAGAEFAAQVGQVAALTSLERGGGHFAMTFAIVGPDGEPLDPLDNALVVVPEAGGPARFVQGFEEWMGDLVDVVR